MQFRFLILFLTIVCGLSASLRGLIRDKSEAHRTIVVEESEDKIDLQDDIEVELDDDEIQAYRDRAIVVEESEADKIDRQDDIEVEYELLRDLLHEIIQRKRLGLI